jgi:hypothetical protein
MYERGSAEGNCWLCQRYGELSEEHVPPRAAFNSHPILLEEVSRRTRETGTLTWEAGEPRQRGFTVRSLCGRCNSLAGQRYAPPYIEFLKVVAERVGDVRVRHQLTIQKVRKPQLILKQVIHQFVTTNGPTFARADEWVRPFLRVEGDAVLPSEIHVYMFATNNPSVRTTGISGHIYADLNRVNIVSEFTFWPIGTVMSYGELQLEELAPIHQWCKFAYKSNETTDITLCVNPTASSLPVDFRSRDQMNADQSRQATSVPKPGLLDEMGELVAKRAGREKDENYILTSHPSQIDLIRKSEQ